ncbi:MAG TPA: di-heme oxidoredictase family protein [Vicinamibacteria bacterium]|nr:di-heme oxidoredictase family protein [Vicinamibacteria bacterium]
MRRFSASIGVSLLLGAPALAQLVDRTLAPNTANEGIAKSFEEQIGAGRGNVTTPDSSLFIINRDPARAIRRGRQIFQRKFTRVQGHGPVELDGVGDVNNVLAIGAGLSDSCASCHGRPRGSAGAGGDVATRPDSRDAPHLFGLGLKEMLGDEITAELRAIRAQAQAQAQQCHCTVTRNLVGKGISYGRIIALGNGTVNTSQVRGVDADLRVRPFFHHGGTISIREFLVGAFNAEMGLESPDPDLLAASGGARVTTPSGMVLDGGRDAIEAPPVNSVTHDNDDDGVVNEIPTSIVDFMEFYLLHYFKAGTGQTSTDSQTGRQLMSQMGCASCHVPDLTVNRDRRVADVETRFDPAQGNPFNRLFATATLQLTEQDDGSGYPTLKRARLGSFVVRNIFTDFRRHDLGPNFHEREYNGNTRREFMTTPLWGVGNTGPYGHDGRSMNLRDVILRHGGEAQAARDRFANAGATAQRQVLEFLNTLVLFPPDDTASNLQPKAPTTAGYPQFGHGSIRLTALFNDPTDIE